MLFSYQSGTAKRVSRVLTLLLGSITAVSLCCSCLADPVTSPAATGMDWNSGPTTGPLGALGEVSVPSGFKFLDAQGARAYLQQHNQAAPRNLLGLLAPNSESWWAVLQFSDQGYSQHPEADLLNPGELIKHFSTTEATASKDKAGTPAASPARVEWQMVPKYDAQAHTLQWAVSKQNASSPVVVQTLRLLCRRGSVDATVVSPYRGFPDLAPLDKLTKDFSLKAGERYEDYQNGDKLCSGSLAALVKDTALTTDSTLAAASTNSMARTLWLGGAGVACVFVFGGIWIYARGRNRKPRRTRTPEPATPEASAPVAAPAVTRPKLISTPLPAPAAPTPSPERPAAKPQPTLKPASPVFHSRTEALRKPLNGKSHNARRRKVFDYNRYFTDLMGAVSAHSQMEPTAPNGMPLEPGRLPEPTNGQDFGAASAPASTASQQAELLASQRELIDEQKRLIQEQSKLIEEKSRLIAEKNELLKLQNQLMADKLA